MVPPTSRKELQKFIGVINYYCDMWTRRSHTLAPLTKLMFIKRNFKWKKVEPDALNEIKRIVARDNLLTYPYFDEIFKIHTNDSALKLVAVIIHKVKPIAFYIRKLNFDQQGYIVTERELINIVETLKEFRTILLGHKLRIYTVYKNIKCNFFNRRYFS